MMWVLADLLAAKEDGDADEMVAQIAEWLAVEVRERRASGEGTYAAHGRGIVWAAPISEDPPAGF